MDNQQPPDSSDSGSRSSPTIPPAPAPNRGGSFGKPTGGEPPPQEPPSKKDLLQGFGCLALIAVFVLGALSLLLSKCSGDNRESVSGNFVSEDKWAAVPLETRKSLCEMKLRDATELADELERIFRDGQLARLSTWKGEVRFVLSEIDSAGYAAGANPSSMGSIKTALQDMQFASDKFEKSASYGDSLKLMRQNLQYAREWFAKGEY